ncbi:hypothetical protein FPQ18DRAFT_386133 [Pyronema domesticum]|nr:hypothetical protein FPQ18DRAFT_386133 [Pyronema domesticum]
MMEALKDLPSTNPLSFSSTTKPTPVRILKISQKLGTRHISSSTNNSMVTITTERVDETKPLVFITGRDAGVRQRLRIDSSRIRLGFVEMARGEGERRRRGADGWGKGKKEEEGKESQGKEKSGESESNTSKEKGKQSREEEKEEQRPRKRPKKMVERRV